MVTPLTNCPKILNKYKDTLTKSSVSIMRPGPAGNPFVIGKDGDRDQVCDKFDAYFHSNTKLKRWCKENLYGRDLVCCCYPNRCHGQTIYEFLYRKRYTDMLEEVLIIDGTNLFYRSYYQSLNQDSKYNYKDDFPIGGLRMFAVKIRQLFKGKTTLKSDRGVVLLEGGKNFRKYLDNTYKKNRIKDPDDPREIEISQQMQCLPDLLKSMNIPCLWAKHFEADDCIASLSKQALKQGFTPVVVSKDKDLTCLTQIGARVYDPYENTFLPIEGTDWLCLAGDKSDDIPAIPPFGEVRAKQATPKGIVHLLTNLPSYPLKQSQMDSVLNNLPRILLNQKLVDLADAPLTVDFKSLGKALSNQDSIDSYADKMGLISLKGKTSKGKKLETSPSTKSMF